MANFLSLDTCTGEKMHEKDWISTSSRVNKNHPHPLPHGVRKFYQLPESDKTCRNTFLREERLQSDNLKGLLCFINDNVIGNGFVFSGPWGLRTSNYCDYTASARALHCIEDYIQQQVLPAYGNTHTTTTVTSLQTTLYRHEARDIVRNAVNASEHDAVIFAGSGCTAAIHKLINGLNLKQPPVVLFGPYEHHSNLLPWRELGAQMVSIPEDANGLVDINALESELRTWQPSGRQLIGCFSAASNITGILTDTVAITTCLHRFGALAFWDYATAGPYVDIDMNPVIANCVDQSLASKDAIYLSPHKFVGGVETPGILVAKKKLFNNPVPCGGGGGSVFFVTEDDHRYLQQIEMREEGGTPSIIGAIRAGMAFQLKQAVGTANIMDREHELCRKAVEFWSSSPNLILLGNTSVPRLPIFSFLIRHPATGQFLHHNFICAILNDVFGIQTRGGCACAGPYAQSLLGMDQALAKRIETMLLEDNRLDRVHLRRYHEYSEREILRPGFTRLNLPYFMEDECIDFVLSAVAMVAEHGWKLLPQYIFNPETGEWKQRNHKVFQDRRWLGSISYASGKLKFMDPPTPKHKGKFPQDFAECLALAEGIFQKAGKMRLELADQSLLFDSEAEKLRWFMLPSEAQMFLSNKGSSQQAVKKEMPFEPARFEMTTKGDGATYKESQNTENHNDATSSQQKSCKQRQQWTNTEHFQSTVEHGFVGESFGEELHESGDNMTRVPLRENGDKFVEYRIENQQDGGTDDNLNHQALEKHCAVDNVGMSGVNMVGIENTDGQESRSTSTIASSATSPGEVVTDKDSEAVALKALTSTTKSGKSEVVSVGNITRTEDKDVLPSSCNARGVSDTSVRTTETNLVVSDEITNVTVKDIHAQTTGTMLTVAKETRTTTNPVVSDLKAKDTHAKITDTLPKVAKETRTMTTVAKQITDVVKTGDDKNTGLKSDEVRPKIGESVCELSPQGKTECLPCMLPRRTESHEEPRDVKQSVVAGGTVAVKFHAPPKKIFKPTLQALEEYQMLQDGDKVLVCLSGGKDSLSLLHTLRQYQFVAKKKGIHFDLGAVTVDPQTSSFDPSPLKGYLKSLGLPYFYEEQCIIDQAASLQDGCDSICSFCSRMKRGRLYACARREGYNILAMGQHLDDLTESFLMSVFHNGLLRTMKANYVVKEGDLRVIRPFVYVREKHLREFAEQSKLPVIPENCPACFEAPKERHRTKQLLAGQEVLFPRLYSSLQTALKPLMAKNRTGLESSLNKKKYSNGNIEEEDDDDM